MKRLSHQSKNVLLKKYSRKQFTNSLHGSSSVNHSLVLCRWSHAVDYSQDPCRRGLCSLAVRVCEMPHRILSEFLALIHPCPLEVKSSPLPNQSHSTSDNLLAEFRIHQVDVVNVNAVLCGDSVVFNSAIPWGALVAFENYLTPSV